MCNYVVGREAGVSGPVPLNSKLPCARLKSVNVPFHDFTMAVPCSALTFDSAVPLSSTGWNSRVTVCPIIDTESDICVTRWLHDAFHDLRPAIECSHAPSVGDGTLIVSTYTSTEHDFAAAIATPPIFNMTFCPFRIILSFFSYSAKMRVGFTVPTQAFSLSPFLEHLFDGGECQDSQH